MKTSTKSELAALKFFTALLPGPSWHFPTPEVGRVKALVKAAFFLYEREWDCHDHDVREWNWPWTELAAAGGFGGDEPWALLLRRAVELARQQNVSSGNEVVHEG